MRIRYTELGARVGIAPLQVLAEFAAMNQPWSECWPECEEEFAETIKEQRRVRLGLPKGAPSGAASHRAAGRIGDPLPVSLGAAAILNKFVMKGYGLKPVKVFTLTRRWVHEATEDDVRELVRRGNLEWTDGERSGVNLVADRMADTERIVEAFRRRSEGAELEPKK